VALFGRKPATIGDQFKTVLESLCCLEINTIVKDNMTGQKMPPPERALVELAELYDLKLAECGALRSAADGGVTGGPAEYERLHLRAEALLNKWLSDASAAEARQTELMILYRIRDNTDQIQEIFKAAGKRGQVIRDHAGPEASAHPIELTTDEIVVLHKAWDLGLEQIALQTVIHLDGDVLHRVQPRYATGSSATQLLTVHDAAIRTSISYWKTLVDIVGEFIGGVARILGQRG
jgi:hypothetical protein